MTLRLTVSTKTWPMREPFGISRGVQTDQRTIMVTLVDSEGYTGRGEACGVPYAGETPQTMTEVIEAVRETIEADVTREALLDLLPPGGARCALDAAIWDIEAKRSGEDVFTAAGVLQPAPVTTAYTIGIRSPEAYEAAARERGAYSLLKVKVGQSGALEAIAAVRRGAPRAALIVDPNQAWSVDMLKALAPRLAELGVVLLEQPIKVGDEAELDGYRCPIKLCADELINDVADLVKARGRFDVVNIKLDKAGGLTAALRLASSARAAGFELMVGCMAGSSLSMAPAMVLAQQCAFVDLDGPLLQSQDWPDGLSYSHGVVQLPRRTFWG